MYPKFHGQLSDRSINVIAKKLDTSIQELDHTFHHLHQEIGSLKDKYNEHYIWALQMSDKLGDLIQRAEMLKTRAKNKKTNDR
ncbi:hypothetical protein [Chengkuizengella axinellae]|uniref:Uncharacterized protein n=1 Tax=Chengkuizengella axinellae TaxID=3064388 RepID=A0ABT9IZH5_9BACL|nr:hypothetical protein [Chengkuizengella sp. 2205SS18-9]MDP5274781.1 hypothetical protein [Chengkuizengella sp. 2205SS18-9]